MANDVLMGCGESNVTGMFFYAPVGTSLPTSPTATLASDWKKAGYISADGITWATAKDSELLRAWSKEPVRLVSSEEGGTVTAPIIETNKTTLGLIFGEDNIDYTAATSSTGNITSVTVAPGVSGANHAFLFLGRDGAKAFFVGTTNGVIRDLADVAFTSSEAVKWECTIEAAAWTFCVDDGDTTS